MTALPPPPPYGYMPAQQPNPGDKLLIIVAHLGGLLTSLGSVGIFGFVVPLVIYLAWRENATVGGNAREALNFQLTILTLAAAAVLLAVPALIVGVLTFGVGIVVLIALAATVGVLWIVLPLIAIAHGVKGRVYRYPFTLRYVKG